MNTTARKIYLPDSLHRRDLFQLDGILQFAAHDASDASNVAYAGCTREETVATAKLSHQDVMDELHRRAVVHADEHGLPVELLHN